MSTILRFFLHPITLSVLGASIVSALIWWALPLLSIGDSTPFASVGVRASLIAATVGTIAAVHLVRWYLRKRANQALIDGMMDGPSSSDREAAILQERFAHAVEVLQQTSSGKKRGFLQPKQSLYDLPWYVFIGAPGAGKTTALLNAGLQFPLAEKLGQASVRGVGGTRYCDWWFTDQAVLIDTAGRYTLQESDSATDAAAWDTFLALLKKTRPRRPLNGVLLTINVQDLLQQSAPERETHAAKLRARIQELHDKLGVRPPVYVLVTKVDLLAGFEETLGGLNKEEREQVWGFTLPYSPQAHTDISHTFETEFSTLETLIRARLIERMEGERDVLRRASIFAFPQQLAALKEVLGPFIHSVFSGTNTLTEQPLLRGIYLSSGTQEGTPIDRVLGTLARSFGVDRRAATAAQGQRGKSFFLTRLPHEVVFAEQGLVGENRAMAQRKQRIRTAAVATMGVASTALVLGWGISYWRNSHYTQSVMAKVPDLQKQLDAVPAASNGDVTQLSGVLERVRTAAAPANFALNDPPTLQRLGLYQGDKLDAGAHIGYQRVLDHAFIPRLSLRLEERLRTAQRSNLEFAYEALKAYLMLYTPERFDPQTLKPWITLDWDTQLQGRLSAEQVQELETSLDHVLARGVPQPQVPIDDKLVASVRDMLAAFPLEHRVYSRLQRLDLGAGMAEFSVASAVGPNVARVFTRASGEPLTRGIPGLFTHQGYHKIFSPAVEDAVQQLAAEEPWVLGIKAHSNTSVERKLDGSVHEVAQRVRRLYLEEYIKRWDAYIADVQLIKMAGLEQSLQVAKLLAAPDSPIGAYMRALSRETALVIPEVEAPDVNVEGDIGDTLDNIEKAKQQLSALTSVATSALGFQPNTGGAGAPIEQMVDAQFTELHRHTQCNPPPLQDTLKLFSEVYVQLAALDAAQKSKAPPPPPSADLKIAASLQPEPVRAVLEALTESSDAQNRVAQRQGLSAELKPIADFCGRAIAGRYPFAKGAKADALPDDFGQMFGQGGMLDDFYQRRLASIVDTGATPWKFKPLPDGTLPPGGNALADFQRAARIKEVFFRNGGRTPAFRVDVRVLQLDDSVQALTMDIDGKTVQLAPTGSAPTIHWPPQQLASQIRLNTEPAGTPQVFEGSWALFRMFDRFDIKPTGQPERFHVDIHLDGRKALLEVTASSAFNPFRMREMQQFRCPGAL